jgi:aerobic-type carbon monoxide dehydrogenase small subunit (CoxS/CutS family)
MKTRNITLHINEEEYNLDVQVNQTLLQVIRDLGLTGTKYGCGTGECGACTVLLDGKTSMLACLVLAPLANGMHITTIMGLEKEGELHPVQQSFIDKHAIQCGFCTPGMVMKTISILENNPNPTEEELRHELEGNICRCTGYEKIVEAAKHASELMKGASNG